MVEDFEPLPRIDKIFYGMGRFGSTTLLTLISLATFYLYKEIFELSDVLNGYANAIGKLAIMISSIVMGYLSDKTRHPRLGRRKPFIISGSILLAISFSFLFFPNLFIDVKNQLMLFAYEAFWLAAFNFFYGYLLTPYQAWLPEITRPEERAEVSGYENLFNVLGNIVGTGGSFAIPIVAKNAPNILYNFVIIVSIIEIFFYIPSVIRIKEPKISLYQPKFLSELSIVIKDRNFINWIISRGIMSMGHTIMLTVLLGFLSEFLKLTDIKYLGTALFLMVLIMISFAVWVKLSRKKGMIKRLLIIGNILMIVALFSIITLAPQYDLVLKQQIALVYLTLGAFGLAAYWILNYVILANIIDANAKVTGVSRAGTYTGFDGIVLNIFQASGYVIVGYIFALFGDYYGYVYWGPISAVLILLGTIYFYLFVNPEPEVIYEQ
ncbi:MAG: MFS transporter [Candidatus Njordarchaeales archaeon]